MFKKQVVVNITDYSGQLMLNQLSFSVEPSDTILGLKKDIILNIEQNHNWKFPPNFYKSLRSEMIGYRIADKNHFSEFGDSSNNCLYINIKFPDRPICLQIEGVDKKFYFEGKMNISKCMSFLKAQTGLNYKNFKFRGNPIKFDAVDMDKFFQTNAMNIIENKPEASCKNETKEEAKEETKQQLKKTDPTNMGTIYLIRTREFKNSGQNIFKIGKTGNDISKRLGNYGKGGEVYFSIAVKPSILDCVEKDLVNIFTQKFIQKQDIGKEYFEGNYIEMIREIYSFCFEKLK